MKIYKASVESFAVEVSEGKTADAGLPIVYLQVVQRGKNASLSSGGTLPMLAVDVTVTGWTAEGRPVEWRGSVGSAPEAFREDVARLWTKAEKLKREVRRLLENRCQVREGVVSEEPVYGELPVPQAP
jgi:hypothetical protein